MTILFAVAYDCSIPYTSKKTTKLVESQSIYFTSSLQTQQKKELPSTKNKKLIFLTEFRFNMKVLHRTLTLTLILLQFLQQTHTKGPSRQTIPTPTPFAHKNNIQAANIIALYSLCKQIWKNISFSQRKVLFIVEPRYDSDLISLKYSTTFICNIKSIFN